MILHIVVDDKFIDMAYNMFEIVSPGNNEFMLFTQQDEFKYIKTTPITKVSPEEIWKDEFIEKISNYEFIVIHWLDDHKKQLIPRIPKRVKIVWIGWGGDYYYLTQKRLLMLRTGALKVRLEFSGKERKDILTLLKLVKATFFPFYKDGEMKRVVDRIDYFAPVIEDDYDLVKNSFEIFKPKFIDWNYGTLEDDLVREMDIEVTGDNILIGNSATFENNHLDAFNALREIDLKDKKIVVPLSYGIDFYRNEIIKYGKNQFGINFQPLVEFMGIDEYNRTISSCSTVIMSHLRQQAMGNIISSMHFGARIFMQKNNLAYEFFKRNGALVFCLDEINNKEFGKRLTDEEIEINRNFLRKYWSREVIIRKTEQLIKELKK